VRAAPLRRWRLIELAPGDLLTASRLQIDERVLHYLTGVSYIDARLQWLTELTASDREAAPPRRRRAASTQESLPLLETSRNTAPRRTSALIANW